MSDLSLDELRELERQVAGALPVCDRGPRERELAAALEAATRRLDEETLARGELHHRLARVLYQLGEDEALAALAMRVCERIGDARFLAEIGKIVPLLQHAEAGDSERLLETTRRLCAAAPENVEFALLHVRQLATCEAPREEQSRVLEEALLMAPEHPGILERLARLAIEDSRFEEAEDRLAALSRLRPSADVSWRLGEVLLRRGKREAALAAFGAIGPRLPVADLGIFAPALRELCDLANRNYYVDERIDLDALRARLQRSLEALRDFLSREGGIAPRELISVAYTINRINGTFWWFKGCHDEIGFTVGEFHGTLDLRAFGVLAVAMHEHLLAILTHGLCEGFLSQRLDSLGFIRTAVALYASVLLEREEAARACETLEKLVAMGFDGQFFRNRLELCRLHAAQAAGVPPTTLCLRLRAASSNGLHPTAFWEEWARAQGRESRILTPAAPGRARYTVVTAGEATLCGEYRQHSTNLELLGAGRVSLRESELLFGDGILFRPHPIYGPFPRANPPVRDRGPRAMRMRAAQRSVVIDEPVIVLANNDAYRMPNYSHWIFWILERLNVIVRAGLVASRRVLMPAEITDWMRQTLPLVGLPDERILYYPHDVEVIARDAEVVSPIEIPGPELLAGLRERMWAGAGVSATAVAEPAFLFLARRMQIRAMLIDEDRIYALAERLGFTVVSPERLRVAEQVRLFARAAGVAGPQGSAFANLLFCRSGVRVLALQQEEFFDESELDTAIACGLEFRWLLGRSEPNLARYRWPRDAPFAIDLRQLEQQLVWVREGMPAGGAAAARGGMA